METGRHPALPMANMFPYLRKKEENPEAFVVGIVTYLEKAFERVKMLQEAASKRNKERQPDQYKPSFKPGDYLLLFARSAKDGRVEEKDEEGRDITLPTKLRNAFTGPYKMVRWLGERKCIILMDGKEVAHNVNRLIKHHAWDDVHITTSEKKVSPAMEEEKPPSPSELIIFPMAITKDHKAPFGVGQVIKVRGPNDVFIQWWGHEDKCKPKGVFKPGWVQKDNRAYFATNRYHAGDRPWTNEDSATDVRVSAIVLRGAPGEIFSSAGHFRVRVKDKLEEVLDVSIEWEELDA
jgi:hypothetical protein